MEFLFRKALALIGRIDDPTAQKRLFDRFGGGDELLSLYEKMEKAASDPGIGAPDVFDDEFPDPNMVAGYLDHPSEQSRYQRLYEESCLDSDLLLAEAASVSVILNLYQEKSTRAPKSCRRRAYLVEEKASLSASDRVKPSDPSTLRGADSERYDSKSEENPFAQRRTVSLPARDEDDFTGLDTAGSGPSGFFTTEDCRRAPRSEISKRSGLKGNLVFLVILIGILYAVGPKMVRSLRNSTAEPVPISGNQENRTDSEPELVLPPLPDEATVTPRHEVSQTPSVEKTTEKDSAATETAPWKSLSLLPESESLR